MRINKSKQSKIREIINNSQFISKIHKILRAAKIKKKK
jgi:hypothetical protein